MGGRFLQIELSGQSILRYPSQMVNIDWKKVSRSKGYKRLKAELFHQRHRWDDERYTRTFRWVIGRAMHYSQHTGRSLSDILNEWENKRTYSALNYYQSYRFPKLKKESVRQFPDRA